MALREPIGIWFSSMKDNWEEKDFYYDFLVYSDGVKDDTRVHYTGKYRCYGDLPDGSHFGVWVFPSMISFADFRDPPFTGIIIVGEDEKCRFVLWVGNKRLIERRLFDRYIESCYSV